MLEMAYKYRDELLNRLASIADDPKYQFYFNGYVELPNIKASDWNDMCRVSVTEDGKVVGYMSATIYRRTGVADNLRLIRLQDSPSLDFMKDVGRYLLAVSGQARKMEWSCIEGNPVMKGYRKLIKILGGREIGYLTKTTLINQVYRDQVLFELMFTDEVKHKLESWLARR